jgi:hypothetical protein
MFTTLDEQAFARVHGACRASGVPFEVDANPYEAYLQRKQAFDAYCAKLSVDEAGKKRVDYLLMAEAPPLIDSGTYFYFDHALNSTHWFKVPALCFLGHCNPANQTEKQEMLDELAAKGVLLVDLCPFPLSKIARSHPYFPMLIDMLYKLYFRPYVLDPLTQGGHIHTGTKVALMATLKTNQVVQPHLAGYAGVIGAAVTVPTNMPRPASYTAPSGVLFENTIKPRVLAGLTFKCYACATNGPHGYLLSGALL